jgi:crotonobetainyl-CoA:carnitine CoA-transferase CaiB-like acyl-CoA transferase
LIEIIESITATRPSAYWLDALDTAGVPCGPLNDYAAVLADPHLAAREFILTMEHPRAGQVRATGFPVRLSATPAALRRPAPTLGQHTQEVLAELGVSTEEVEALNETGVV